MNIKKKMWQWLRHAPEKVEPVQPTVWVPATVLDRTSEVLRQSGSEGDPHEGIAYWAGRRAGDDWFVMTCIAPVARTTYGSFDTSSETNARVIMHLATAGLELLGQVHSHPGESVGHSAGDERRALMPYEGFFSIVVPYYASRGMRPLTICGVHIFEKSRFRRLTTPEMESRFRTIDELADLRT